MLANSLSGVRVGLVPLVLLSLRNDGELTSWTSICLILAAATTDLLDGMVARRFDQVSSLGRVLDPLADKIFVASLGMGLVIWKAFPWWLLAAQVARDLAIVAAGLFLIRCRDTLPVPSRLGKYTTFSMVLAMSSYVTPFPIPAIVQEALVVGAAVLLVLSSVDYGRRLGSGRLSEVNERSA